MDTFDIAVIGAGVAGLGAAASLGSEGHSVIVLDSAEEIGGQMSHSHLIENVIGHGAGGFAGWDFADAALAQCRRFGVSVYTNCSVTSYTDAAERAFRLQVVPYTHPFADGFDVLADSILLAVGLTPQSIPFPYNVQKQGVGCVVTNRLALLDVECGDHVLVYGGGNSAGQAACYYAKQGCITTLMSRRPLEHTMDASQRNNMQVCGVEHILGEIVQVEGYDISYTTEDTHMQGDYNYMQAHYLHCMLGGVPATSSGIAMQVSLDADGYIAVDREQRTSVPGIFAAGDCMQGSHHQVACAIGLGASSGPAINTWLDKLRMRRLRSASVR